MGWNSIPWACQDMLKALDPAVCRCDANAIEAEPPRSSSATLLSGFSLFHTDNSIELENEMHSCTTAAMGGGADLSSLSAPHFLSYNAAVLSRCTNNSLAFGVCRTGAAPSSNPPPGAINAALVSSIASSPCCNRREYHGPARVMPSQNASTLGHVIS
jgi:hypothetical protein